MEYNLKQFQKSFLTNYVLPLSAQKHNKHINYYKIKNKNTVILIIFSLF